MGGQAPAMYGYGGHQLEDLAALQRSTLAASLPQLVGSAGGQGGNNQNTAKGPSTGYYDPSSQFGGAGVPSTLASRQDQQSSFGGDNSKFGGGVSDSTSSPVPTSVANAGQPTPFNALASTFAAAAPQQHPTLPPGYAYFYGGVGGMPGALQAYGQGVGGGVYPATHPGIPVPTAAGATNTSQFQNKPYASSYGTSYDSLNLGQSNSGYGKNNYGSDNKQAKAGTRGTGKCPWSCLWSNWIWILNMENQQQRTRNNKDNWVGASQDPLGLSKYRVLEIALQILTKNVRLRGSVELSYMLHKLVCTEEKAKFKPNFSFLDHQPISQVN